MNNNRGFTLLEVLIVLSVFSILITLSVPLAKSFLEKQEAKQFLNTLNSDILLLQNLSLGIRENHSKIKFHKEYYTFYKVRTESPIIRHFPDDWEMIHTTYKQIYFVDGTINKAGNILIQTTNKKIRIVFPLGKGRGYIRDEP